MAESQTFYVSYAPAMEVLQQRGNLVLAVLFNIKHVSTVVSELEHGSTCNQLSAAGLICHEI